MKSYYLQQSLAIFLTVILLVGSTDIKNLNSNLNEIKDLSKLSTNEVNSS